MNTVGTRTLKRALDDAKPGAGGIRRAVSWAPFGAGYFVAYRMSAASLVLFWNPAEGPQHQDIQESQLPSDLNWCPMDTTKSTLHAGTATLYADHLGRVMAERHRGSLPDTVKIHREPPPIFPRMQVPWWWMMAAFSIGLYLGLMVHYLAN